MTVESNIAKAGPFVGSGQAGPFTVNFRFLENSHLKVVQTLGVVETVLELSIDYTVIGAGSTNGGTVTLTSPLPAGQTLTIIRAVPVTQETAYVQSDSFPAQSHEDALDKLTMIAQQNAASISGAIRIPESTSDLPTLPAAAARIGTSLVFDGQGNPAVAAALPSGTQFQYGVPFIDMFTPNGGTLYALSANPGLLRNLDVSVGGVPQLNGVNFTWSASNPFTLISSTPWPTDAPVQVAYTQPLPIGLSDAGITAYDAVQNYAPGTAGYGLQHAADYDPSATYDKSTLGFALNSNEVYVGKNTAADAAALNAAIARNAGGSLTVVGTVLLTSAIQLASGSVYDFRKASIINKNTIDGYGVRGTGISGTTLIGGKYTPHPSIVTATHSSGTYGSGSAIQFNNCVNCHVTRAEVHNFYGAINFYNSSFSTANHNFLSDNAGGIQCLASSSISTSFNVRGVDFSHNIILHSGDDGLSFLIGAGLNGSISNSKIAFNYISKDAGTHGTNGQARGIALVGEPTTGNNNIFGVEVVGNIGYYMGAEFIRTTGVIKSTIAHNTVDGYSANGPASAYVWGSTLTGAYGVIDNIYLDNRSLNPTTNSHAVVIDGAVRCKFLANFAKTSIAGEGAMRLDNSTDNLLRDNTMQNPSAYGIALASTSVNNKIIDNDVSMTVAGISDLGTGNFKDRNVGWSTRAVGQITIGSSATSVVVNHGVNVLTASRLRVSIMSLDGAGSATKWWANGFSTTQFTINVNSAPGATIFFQWEAYESAA